LVCEHLAPLEQALLARGIAVTFRGQAWSKNCREWVYFDCHLDVAAIRRHFSVPESVATHSHRGTHDGQELGLVCTTCQDGIMGSLEAIGGKPVFDGRV
jgi:hypothetical protein